MQDFSTCPPPACYCGLSEFLTLVSWLDLLRQRGYIRQIRLYRSFDLPSTMDGGHRLVRSKAQYLFCWPSTFDRNGHRTYEGIYKNMGKDGFVMKMKLDVPLRPLTNSILSLQLTMSGTSRSATGDNAISITAMVSDDSEDIGTSRSDNEDEASQCRKRAASDVDDTSTPYRMKQGCTSGPDALLALAGAVSKVANVGTAAVGSSEMLSGSHLARVIAALDMDHDLTIEEKGKALVLF
ncbi:hypothetical protein IMY05_C1152001000 [Salix suchowensis]|nr:hypothetical protein IMY05_C1152001000 [Salix suchowensis]